MQPVLPEAPRPLARLRRRPLLHDANADALEDEELQAEQAAQAQFPSLSFFCQFCASIFRSPLIIQEACLWGRQGATAGGTMPAAEYAPKPNKTQTTPEP